KVLLINRVLSGLELLISTKVFPFNKLNSILSLFNKIDSTIFEVGKDKKIMSLFDMTSSALLQERAPKPANCCTFLSLLSNIFKLLSNFNKFLPIPYPMLPKPINPIVLFKLIFPQYDFFNSFYIGNITSYCIN